MRVSRNPPASLRLLSPLVIRTTFVERVVCGFSPASRPPVHSSWAHTQTHPEKSLLMVLVAPFDSEPTTT